MRAVSSAAADPFTVERNASRREKASRFASASSRAPDPAARAILAPSTLTSNDATAARTSARSRPIARAPASTPLARAESTIVSAGFVWDLFSSSASSNDIAPTRTDASALRPSSSEDSSPPAPAASAATAAWPSTSKVVRSAAQSSSDISASFGSDSSSEPPSPLFPRPNHPKNHPPPFRRRATPSFASSPPFAASSSFPDPLGGPSASFLTCACASARNSTHVRTGYSLSTASISGAAPTASGGGAQSSVDFFRFPLFFSLARNARAYAPTYALRARIASTTFSSRDGTFPSRLSSSRVAAMANAHQALAPEPSPPPVAGPSSGWSAPLVRGSGRMRSAGLRCACGARLASHSIRSAAKNAALRWLDASLVEMAFTRRCALCAATAESRRSRVPRRSYANDAPTGASKSERERACARARARARSEGESSPTPSAASSASSAVTPTRMRSTSVAGATSAHATPSGRRLAAPASKYAARRSSVADFRMRSASPAPTNVGSPFASTVFRASEARVTPSANGSGSAAGSEDEGSEDEGSEARDALEEGVSSESPEVARRSPSRRRWTRSTVTSRFPRTVSINPAYRPLFSSGFTSVSFASASEASLFLAAANHRRSPSSTSARFAAAAASSHRRVRSSTESASSGSANPATTYTSSTRATTGFFPSDAHGILSASLPTTPLWTRKGRPRALSASTRRRTSRRTMLPVNTATLRSLVLMPCAYAPSTSFSTDASLPSNIARQRRTRRARSARRTRPPTNQDDPGVATERTPRTCERNEGTRSEPLWARKTTRRLRRRASAGALPRPRSRERAPASARGERRARLGTRPSRVSRTRRAARPSKPRRSRC